jgi:hypothetical protein
MSDRRFIDREDLPVARVLLRAMKDDAPSPGSQARALEALGLAGAALAGGTVVASQSASVGAKGALTVAAKWILVSAVLGMVGAVAVLWPASKSLPRNTDSVQPLTVPSMTSSAVAPVAPTNVPPSTSTVNELPSGAILAPSALPRIAKTSAPSAEPAPPPLADAIALIDSARAALAARNPNSALTALNRHDGEFPASPLRPESDVLRVEALAMRGDRAAAAWLARSIIERMPGTANARRARAVLDVEIP